LLVLSLLTDVCRDHSESYDVSLDTDARLLSCVKKAIGFIRSESQREISLDEICELVGLSKFYFAREFKRITGHTIVHYINLTRCESAKVMLCESDTSIAQVASLCGFSDQSYFTRVFKLTTGMSPTEYRKENVKIK
jgi:two-component system response regulator YesN